MNFFQKLFSKKLKLKETNLKFYKIPLTENGREVGTFVECYEGDHTYRQLVLAYGKIPETIEIKPLK